jgi:hypothetical protein
VVGKRLYFCRVHRYFNSVEGNFNLSWSKGAVLCNAAIVGKEARGPELFPLSHLPLGPGCYRWRVSGDCVWETGSQVNLWCDYTRVPLKYLGNPNFVPEVVCNQVVDPLWELAHREDRSFGHFVPEPPTAKWPWDFLPERGNRVSVFYVREDEVQVWKGTYSLDHMGVFAEADQPHWDGEKPGTEKGQMHYPPLFRLKTDLKGSFLTYADDTHFLFVTEGGQIHACPKSGKTRRTEVLWKDSVRPVRLLLGDATTGKTFAFAHRDGPPTKEWPDVYFPLASKVLPISLPRTADSPASATDREEALLAAARLLIKAGRIKAVTTP